MTVTPAFCLLPDPAFLEVAANNIERSLCTANRYIVPTDLFDIGYSLEWKGKVKVKVGWVQSSHICNILLLSFLISSHKDVFSDDTVFCK